MRTVIIPAKKKSKRIPHKNLQLLGDMTLIERCIVKMLLCKNIDRIVVDTDSDEILNLCESHSMRDSRLVARSRSVELLGDDVGTPQLCVSLLEHHADITFLGIMHSTAPFLKAGTIDKCMETFVSAKDEYDSLFTVEPLNDYLWKDKPLNFNVDCRTSTDNVELYYKLTGGFFVSTRQFILDNKTFIGKNPLIYPVPVLESLDINYPDELELARLIQEGMTAHGKTEMGM
ncbi:MAG: hypothetical protein DHS20C01_13920 [marine bacterium B5-7]|nr:MAG: hypothetical protein DHS20C01_13920 [marine bacterium B5-7]